MLVCAALFMIGGWFFLTARRDIAPPIFVIHCALISQSWWAFAALTAVAIFHLGYGSKSFFRHCFGDGWGRGVWGLLAGVALSTWALITNHLGVDLGFIHLSGWIVYALYLGLCFTLENVLKKIFEPIGDALDGIGFYVLIFLIH